MRYDALIFDIDGTLWDSCEAVRKSWQKSLRKHYGCFGSPDLSQVRSIMGLSPDEISEKLFFRFGTHAREVFDVLSEDECAFLAENGADVYPGVSDGLRELARTRRLFLVSNCQRGYIEAFLHSCGFEDYFEACLCAGVTGLEKSENLKKLMREHNLLHSLFVGDTRSDERAAREAGCDFVLAAYGFGDAESPDAVLPCFAALPEILNELEEV